jgi:hypothetical protein
MDDMCVTAFASYVTRDLSLLPLLLLLPAGFTTRRVADSLTGFMRHLLA